MCLPIAIAVSPKSRTSTWSQFSDLMSRIPVEYRCSHWSRSRTNPNGPTRRKSGAASSSSTAMSPFCSACAHRLPSARISVCVSLLIGSALLAGRLVLRRHRPALPVHLRWLAARRLPAVDRDDRSGDERRFWRAEPEHGLGDLSSLPCPPHRRGEAGQTLRLGAGGLKVVGQDWPWRHNVDPDPLVGVVQGRDLGQPD